MNKMKLPDGWKYIKLSELFDEVSEKNHSDAEVLTIVQGVGTVPRKDSGRDIIYDKNSLSNYKYVRKDDFIIHLRSFEGGLEIANQEGIVSPAYIILRTKIQAESGYLYTLFHSNRFINQTMAPSVEGVRDGRTVKYEVLKNQSIPFPSLAEQQKIAKILCKQDKIISLKQKLLEQKQQQKKWLMQKLLEVPYTNADCIERFSLDGVLIDKSGWKKARLESICAMKSGNTITSKDFLPNGIYPVYGGNGLRGYTNSYTHDGDFVLVGRQGALCGNVKYVNGRFFATEHAIVVSPFESTSLFMYYLLESMYLNKLSESSAQPGLSVDKVLRLYTILPSFPEQKIIAQVLSTADKEIALLKSSIEQEKQKKKSLAQLLLTGTVRVNI